MDSKSRDILTEIAKVTRDIEENYPELQKYLDETRNTLPHGESLNLDNIVLQEYLDGLKSMVEKYKSKA